MRVPFIRRAVGDWETVPATETFSPQDGPPPHSDPREWKHRFEDNGDLVVMFRTAGSQDGPAARGFHPDRLFQVWVTSPEVPFAARMRRGSDDPALYVDDGLGGKRCACPWPNAQLRTLRARGWMRGNCMPETAALAALFRGAGIPASEFHRST